MRQWSVFLILFLNFFTSKAQDSTLRYDATLIASASSGKTPFWGYANQSGAVPTNGKFVLGKWGIAKTYNIYNPRLLQWSAGAELITSYSDKENLFFTDLFVTGKIGPLELLVGQKKNITGLVDSTLSSGSMSVSGNSRPFPRIQLSIPKFYPLYFTGDYVAIKASYSDGALGNTHLSYGDTKYEPFTYFHQKSLYFRLGFPDQRFNIYAGFNHQVIWGGENRIWPADNLTKADAYWHAVTGKAVYYKKTGLHFGTVDLAAEWKGVNWSFFLYRQNIYETGSLYKIINFSDGLNGLSIRRSNPLSRDATYFALQSFVLEVVGTKNQLNKTPPFGLSIYENGDYYNSFLYQNGWSYRDFGIGTPLISQQRETDEKLPVNKSQFSNNNRIWAVHAGASATWLGATILFKSTYSFNYGTYLTPFDSTKKQLSLYLSAEKKMSFWKGTSVIAGISTDYGQLYPNTIAIQLGVRKSGFMN